MKIAYLIHTVYGIGGTIRTVLNQAEAMAALGHDVEVLSLFRHRAAPVLPVGPGVRITPVVDLRKGKMPDDPRSERPSRLYPVEEKLYEKHSELTDALLEQALDKAAPDIAVGTRAGLNILLTRVPDRTFAVVGQEHLTYRMYHPRLMAAMGRAYPRMDALVPVTEADASTYRRRMRLRSTVVRAIPNCVPAPALTADGTQRRTIAAAGRLTGMKGYDLLIDAFARVAHRHPGWTLRIHGRGPNMNARKRQIAAHGLQDRVFMMGAHPRMDEVWAMASFCAVASRDEPFGMTIVEAMRAGLPVVSTDCPLGPAEIITHGGDGLLVATEDAGAIAAGLDTMMGDDDARARMSAEALRTGARYSPETIARRHEELFTTLLEARGASPEPVSPPRAGATAPETDPAHCTAEAAPDGGLKLVFATPPGDLELKGGGSTEPLPVSDRAEAVVDPAALKGAGGAGAVLRRTGDAKSVPVPASLLDLRGTPADAGAHSADGFVVPERGKSGLRVVLRGGADHAEVRSVSVTTEAVTVSGTVAGGAGGGRADGGARLELVPEEDGDGAAAGSAEPVAAPAPVDGDGAFTAAVPASALAGGRAVRWRAVLRRSGGAHRLGRVLLGAEDQSAVTDYPQALCAGPDGALAAVGAGYTRAGALVLHAAPVPADGPADPLRHAVGELSVQWAESGPAPTLLLSGILRSRSLDPSLLGLRLVGDDGGDLPLALAAEQGPGGLRYTARARLDRHSVPFGRWRVLLRADGVDIAPHCPSAPKPRRWWIGPRPVYGRIQSRERTGTALVHAPVDIPRALQRRIRRATLKRA